MAKPVRIPDAGAAGDDNANPLEQVPEVLLGPPFAVVHDAELLERGGDKCPHCHQPAVSGSTAIVKCDCGQLFRIDLLNEDYARCPGCERQYTHAVILCAPDNDEAFAEAVANVLQANGYKVQLPDDDGAGGEPLAGNDDDEEEEDDDDDAPAEHDTPDDDGK
ncbi:MAG: hypothetical protein ACOYD1_12705 [Candidatus Nanopelagicales bacterium]